MKKLSIVIVGLALVATALFLLTRARARPVAGSPANRCTSNLSSIGKVLSLYEMDHPSELPPLFREFTNYVDSPKLFRCPVARTSLGSLTNADQWTSYCLVNLSPTSAPDRVHAFCPPENHHGKGANVLFRDASVQWCSASDFETLIREQGLTAIREQHRQRLRHSRE
jgi:hypothetical protein